MTDTRPHTAPLTAPAIGTARQRVCTGFGDACGAGQRDRVVPAAVALS